MWHKAHDSERRKFAKKIGQFFWHKTHTHSHTHTGRSWHRVKMHMTHTLLIFMCVCVSWVDALTQVATFGNCVLSLDAAFQLRLSSVGTCSTTVGSLDLQSKGIKSLAPGVFASMFKMTWVCYVSEKKLYTCICIYTPNIVSVFVHGLDTRVPNYDAVSTGLQARVQRHYAHTKCICTYHSLWKVCIYDAHTHTHIDWYVYMYMCICIHEFVYVFTLHRHTHTQTRETHK